MKKEKGWRKIRATAVVIILAAILVNALPVQAAAAEEAGAVKDFSADFVYRAAGDAIDNLWEGEAPRRSDLKIISKLPTPAAEQVIQVIIGQSE